MQVHSPVHRANVAFDVFDADRNDYLDLAEFMDALRYLHASITYDEALDKFQRYDKDRNGRISRHEFLILYSEEIRTKDEKMYYNEILQNLKNAGSSLHRP